MRISIFALTLILLCACSHQQSSTVSEIGAILHTQLDSFISQFPARSLPLSIRACDLTIYPALKHAEGNLAHKDKFDEALAYGRIKSNGTYTAVITLGMADCLLPILTTLDKDGKQIDQKMIAIGHCGSGPGFICTEVMTMRADYSLYAADTISEWEINDSTGMILPGGEKVTYVEYVKGQLLSNGKIQLSPILKDTLKVERVTQLDTIR
jgi:hypothetical protein